MPTDPERIAKRRERTERYRLCAKTSISRGEQLAYLALSEAADNIALRLEQKPTPAAPQAHPRASA